MKTDFREILQAMSSHFNIKKSEIILPTPDKYDDEFTLFNNTIEVLNTKEVFQYFEDTELKGTVIFEYIGKNHIAEYTRLSDSDYYFKWL